MDKFTKLPSIAQMCRDLEAADLLHHESGLRYSAEDYFNIDPHGELLPVAALWNGLMALKQAWPDEFGATINT